MALLSLKAVCAETYCSTCLLHVELNSVSGACAAPKHCNVGVYYFLSKTIKFVYFHS